MGENDCPSSRDTQLCDNKVTVDLFLRREPVGPFGHYIKDNAGELNSL